MHTKGKPLGFVKNETYINNKISYSSDDTIVLFTDGVTDTFNRFDEVYGDDRLKELLKNDYDKPKELLDDIVEETVTFRDEIAQFDDITLLITKIL